jgi:hypothetical protein
MRCTVCREVVEVYTPTGAPRLRRVAEHGQCAGNFTAPMTELEHQTDIDRTQRWKANRVFGGTP